MFCVRFRALARMEEDRRVILLNHLGFIQRSYTECCPFRDKCVDILVKQVQMARARRYCILVFSNFHVLIVHLQRCKCLTLNIFPHSNRRAFRPIFVMF